MEFFKKKKEGAEKKRADKKIGPILAAGIALGAAGAPAAEAGQNPIFPEHHYHYRTNDLTKTPPEVQKQMDEDRLRELNITPEKIQRVLEEGRREREQKKKELLGE